MRSAGINCQLQPADIERVVPFEALLDHIAAERAADWIADRRHLHRNPEPSGAEYETTQFISARLQSLGLSCRILPRGVGAIAELTLGVPPADLLPIVIRADIDALRMTDRKSVEYASRCPGLAHACGHDAHTVIALATAEMLTRLQQRLQPEHVPPVRVRFVFQPAEETAEGAAWMVAEGAVDNASAILGLHVDPAIAAGRVGIRYGVLTAQVDEVAISVRGTGGHAARPQHTTDPLASAALLVSALYQSVPRRTDARVPSVFTIGAIHGGTASNVIPDCVDLTGTVRSTDAKERSRVLDTIRVTAAGIAAATGNTIDVTFRSPLGSVINDVTVMSAFEAAAAQVVGPQKIDRIDKPSMGGEDFAVYLDHVRGAMFRLGAAGPGNSWPLLHSPVFDIQESAIADGARIMSRASLLLALMAPP
jgi:amidohydrolase